MKSFALLPRRSAGGSTPTARLLPLAVLALALAGCAEDEVRPADAQTGESEAVAAEDAAPAPDPIAPEDTATRTVAESLAVNEAPEASAAADSSAGAAAQTPRVRYNAGEDPEYAQRMGWPVNGPAVLPGSILPDKRIVCYYGHPNSTRMGALGEFPKEEMLQRLRRQIGEWEAADPATPVQPCLHMVAVVAQSEPGTAGHYRTITGDATVQKVYDWAKEINGIFIVDIQVGTDDIRNILPRFEWILKNPDVHLAIDPEFYMKGGQRPGTKIGTMDAADINYATEFLANLVREHNLPPKVLIVHRFTRPMVTNYRQIKLRPEAQIVVHMDGWGAPWLKRDSYRDYIVQEPVQFTGFKLFYHNDTKKGDPLMAPADLLRLRPIPLYIQYQ